MFSCLCVGALHVITYKKRKNNLKVQICAGEIIDVVCK